MRAERFEGIRRELEEEAERCAAAGRPELQRIDHRKPWSSVFLAAAEDERFWDREVRDKAFLFMGSMRKRVELLDEGHHAPVPQSSVVAAVAGAVPPGPVQRPGAPGAPGRRAKKAAAAKAKKAAAAAAGAAAAPAPAQTPPPPAPRGDPRGGAKGLGKGGKVPLASQECYKYTRDEVGCRDPCPHGRLHPACPKCAKQHPHQAPCPH